MSAAQPVPVGDREPKNLTEAVNKAAGEALEHGDHAAHDVLNELELDLTHLHAVADRAARGTSKTESFIYAHAVLQFLKESTVIPVLPRLHDAVSEAAAAALARGDHASHGLLHEVGLAILDVKRRATAATQSLEGAALDMVQRIERAL